MAEATQPAPDMSGPLRPLPIGVFPLPFGYLLQPGGTDTAAVRSELLAGRLPEAWPPALRGHELALAGEFDQAVETFRATSTGDPVSRYNQFVIEPDGVDPVALRADLGELGVLVDVVQFTLGRSDLAPEAGSLDGELLALVLAAQAAGAVGGGEVARAADLLVQAVTAVPAECPALRGVLSGALAHMYRLAGQLAPAVAAYTAGIAALTDTDLTVALAEQQLELGTAYQEAAADRPDLLVKAVHHYHCAIQLVNQQDTPDLFAAAHANLAAAYLTMPMVEASDTLRLGVAVGSLRAALEVYQPDSHPKQWASVQLNLANALVYAPSTHQGDNLVEAVELYEAVLVTRDRESDPLGFARVLANQGNALAHLGLFDHAWGKLVEARFLFEEFHEYDAVTSVRGLLDEISRHRTLAKAEV